MKNIAVVSLEPMLSKAGGYVENIVESGGDYFNVPLGFGSVLTETHRFITVIREYHDKIGKMSIIDAFASRYMDSDHIRFVYNIVDTEVDLIGNIFRKLYEQKPDLVVTWNIEWTLRLMMRKLEENGVQPEQVMTSPTLPEQHRYARYYSAPKYKRHSTDPRMKVMIHPADRKNRFDLSADFKFIDAMHVYRKVFPVDNDQTYGLSNILEKHKIDDLFVDPYPNLTRLAWHIKYQTENPAGYIFDTTVEQLGILELDKKTGFLTNLSSAEEHNY